MRKLLAKIGMDIEKKKEEGKEELNDGPNYRGIKAMPFVIGTPTSYILKLELYYGSEYIIATS